MILRQGVGKSNHVPLLDRLKEKQYFSLFSQMAQAVIFDLGLNKPTESANAPACNPEPSNQCGPSAPGAPRARTMEERRAVLGCYYITSM